RRPGLVLGDDDLADPAAWTRGKPADVVGDLHQGARERLQGAVKIDEGVMGGEGLELVVGAPKGKARELRDAGRTLGGVVGVRVQAGADGGSAQGELVDVGEGVGDRA